MGAISYLNDRVSRGSITGNIAIGGAPHRNMDIDVVISGAPYGSTSIDAAIDCAPHGDMAIDVAIGSAPRGSMAIDAAIGSAPRGSMPICIAIGCAHHRRMSVDAAIGGAPHRSMSICVAIRYDIRRIYLAFNKVKLRYSFFAAAELAEGAVTARFFLVGLYEGNARVKEFVKHMAHSDLEVG